MPLLSVPVHAESKHPGLFFRGCHQWLDFNRHLDRDAQMPFNERQIEQRLDELMRINVNDPRFYWLTVARIAELTLKQAGDYADCCEFQAAGDLLANPRWVDVYVRGKSDSISKNRHGGLSDQFASAIGGEHPVNWLRRETITAIRREALLPCLKKMLAKSEVMRITYMAGFDRRMRRIAGTIGFFAAWQICDQNQLLLRLEAAGPEGRELVSENQCRFSLAYFTAMGAEIEKLASYDDGQSRFLN